MQKTWVRSLDWEGSLEKGVFYFPSLSLEKGMGCGFISGFSIMFH